MTTTTTTARTNATTNATATVMVIATVNTLEKMSAKPIATWKKKSSQIPEAVKPAEKDVRALKIVKDSCKNDKKEAWMKKFRSIEAKIDHNNVLRSMKIAELKQLDQKNHDLKVE